MEPIRVYSGMPTGGAGIEVAAATVVAELRRTGAFDRAVILIAASTGSGWVDEWQVQPLEFLTRGNCATASLQYSYVPSALNWLTGLEPAQEASAALFRAVRAELDTMDEADRPALFVCGESLGAFASQSVFSSVEEALEQVDGALWVGTPAFTPMHAELTAERHKGSPEVAPVVYNGRRVRRKRTLRPAHRPVRARAGSVEIPATDLRPASLRPGRVVEPSALVESAGLAAREGGARRVPLRRVHALRDLHSGACRPARRGYGPRRSRSYL